MEKEELKIQSTEIGNRKGGNYKYNPLNSIYCTCGADVYLLRGCELPDGNVQGAEGPRSSDSYHKQINLSATSC